MISDSDAMKQVSNLEDNLRAEIEQLRQLLAELTREKVAFATQKRLLETFLAIARSPTQEEVLNHFLHQILDLSAQITGSEKGSLFLLDPLGRVEDAILTREETCSEERRDILSQVLDKGLAGWVNRYRQISLINDTFQDERWLNLAEQPYTARSVLCVPILRSGNLLGILTLLHAQPYHYSDDAVTLMKDTADRIGIVLENAKLYGKLQQYSQTLDAELEKGRQIQINFLPAKIPEWDGWEIATFLQPARQLSGDFYDIFELPQKQIGIIIADVCDKGVGAALFMGLFRSLIRIFSGQTSLEGLNFKAELVTRLQAEFSPKGAAIDAEGLPISDSIEKVNQTHLNALKAMRLTNDYIAINHGSLAMFATIFFGAIDPETGELTYINGGHEPLFVLANNGGIKEELKATGPAVGVVAGIPFRVRQTYLQPGDILFGYTDGVPEARAEDGTFFGKDRLRNIVSGEITSGKILLEQISRQVLAHIGWANRFDDITMVAVKRLSSDCRG